MTTQDGNDTPTAQAQIISLVPRNVSRDQFAVASLVATGALLLWGLRRGMRGIGPIELTGSNPTRIVVEEREGRVDGLESGRAGDA